MFIDSFLLLIFGASFWSYKIPKLLKLLNQAVFIQSRNAKSIFSFELNMPSIAKNKWFWPSLNFCFHILYNRSCVIFCHFLAVIVGFLVCWLTSTNECCVYPTVSEVLLMSLARRYALWECRKCSNLPLFNFTHFMKCQVSVLIRARDKQKQHKLPWRLSVTCSVDRLHNKTRALISHLHQWPVETSRDSFEPFFGSVTQVQTHFPDSTRVIYFSMSTNGEFLISWPLLAFPKSIWHSM